MNQNLNRDKNCAILNITANGQKETTPYVVECREYAKAIDFLADTYGQDVRALILNRHVRLSYAQVVRLAGAVERTQEAFPDLGQIIRAGNSRQIQSLVPRIKKRRK